MKTDVRIALIGDYDARVKAHMAIPKALMLTGDSIGCAVESEWIATRELAGDAAQRLSAFHGIWCVPGSPYQSMDGALAAIRFAREQKRPFLGTCGGSQHALIEYARNALGLMEADHAESNPAASMPLIAPLACALREARGAIKLTAGSRVREIYGREETIEGYNCSFGFNPKYGAIFQEGRMCVTGVDENDEVRVVELVEHPFFIATLFQPERSAFNGETHPLIRAFVEAAGRLAEKS
jgi:CTP synthase (UTP-ammonia lyase)